MSTALAAARLRYLDGSARMLSRTAPTISAVMEAEHDTLFRAQNARTSAKRDTEICNACGNVFAPGKTCHVKLVRTQQSVTRKKSAKGKASKNCAEEKAGTRKPEPRRKMLVYACGRCHRETRFDREPTNKRHPASKSAPHNIIRGATVSSVLPRKDEAPGTSVTLQKPTPSIATLEPKPNSNAASKQRAKTRKQGGLQAMLAKSKADAAAASTSGGFDLMDFLKPS